MELFDLRPYTRQEEQEAELFRSWVNVSSELLSARLAQNLTQADVARLAGTKQGRVSEIESMTGNPRFDTLDRVALAVGLMVTLQPRAESVASGFATRSYGVNNDVTDSAIVAANSTDNLVYELAA